MNYFNESLKQYFKHFKILLIITLSVILIGGVVWTVSLNKEEDNGYYESPNNERVYGDRRVFDYGDQLSDYEEDKLESFIHEAEKKICCDIVIVTLNESLADYEPEYRARYSVSVTPDKWVMVYADKFWEDNKFGYDHAQILDGTQRTGDGVILVDNVHREEQTGKIYTWMGTTGICETNYSSAMIDNALDRFYDEVEYDYYAACEKWVNQVVKDMGGKGSHAVDDGVYGFVLVAGLLILIIYFCVNAKEKAGKVTVSDTTYLESNSLRFSVKEDRFIRKTVTKHYNPPQSSGGGGGGGGHHVSGGGGSHGGGGHSR